MKKIFFHAPTEVRNPHLTKSGSNTPKQTNIYSAQLKQLYTDGLDSSLYTKNLKAIRGDQIQLKGTENLKALFPCSVWE